MRRLSKKLRKVQVSQCVKNFLWRSAKQILPMRKRLEQRGIQLVATWALCPTGEELQDHIFMQCKEIQRLWFISPLDFHMPPILNLSDWLLQWVSSPDSTVSQLFTHSSAHLEKPQWCFQQRLGQCFKYIPRSVRFCWGRQPSLQFPALH